MVTNGYLVCYPLVRCRCTIYLPTLQVGYAGRLLDLEKAGTPLLPPPPPQLSSYLASRPASQPASHLIPHGQPPPRRRRRPWAGCTRGCMQVYIAIRFTIPLIYISCMHDEYDDMTYRYGRVQLSLRSAAGGRTGGRARLVDT